MQTILQISVALLCMVALGSFVGGFAANLCLIPYLDPQEVKERTGRSAFWQFGNAAVPIECYKKGGHIFWRMRDRCLKTFAVCAGLLALLALAAAIFNIPFDASK